jgi:hypothetical protein
MKDLELYTRYAMKFGLTFLPIGFDDKTWQAAVELMKLALEGKIVIVTHELIDSYVAVRNGRCVPVEGCTL